MFILLFASETGFACAKNDQDLNKLRREIDLTCLSKILSRSYKGVPRNSCHSRSWEEVSNFARIIMILHDMHTKKSSDKLT